VQQAANGWLQPFVTSAAPYRSAVFKSFDD
jgi:hypothetical protein